MGSVPIFPRFQTLVDVATVERNIDNPWWILIDCRFSLQDPQWGRSAYAQGSLPGAQYAHLEDDLSAPCIPGKTGRHPLPDIDQLVRRFSEWGIGRDHQVVAFDDQDGGFAARLWWLLHWLGHDSAAILDGGIAAWIGAGHVLQAPSPLPAASSRPFVARPRDDRVATAEDVMAAVQSVDVPLIDARAPERYRGTHEPIDRVGGHIPGACNADWRANLASDHQFLAASELRARYEAALAGRDAANAIIYCGSGVTACHDVLAVVHGGFPMPRLYVGSWSEWITDPQRPQATGPGRSI